MVLYINTKDRKVITVSLKKEGRVVTSLSERNEYGSQVLLPLIENLLKSQKLTFKNLAAVEVETGPGSFTGLKVGVAVANALGFALNIPVNSRKIEIKLRYS